MHADGGAQADSADDLFATGDTAVAIDRLIRSVGGNDDRGLLGWQPWRLSAAGGGGLASRAGGV
jgi:hypothetical protein